MKSSAPLPFSVICQADRQSREERLVAQEALVRDIPLCRAGLEDLGAHAQALASGKVLPIGSVEFVREAFRFAGIIEPANLSYPLSLKPYLHRQLHKRAAGSVLGRWFIKPTTTKAFTGFVFDTLGNPDHLSAHDRVQYDAFLALPPEALVWVSEPVTWRSEVRYYVLDGRILGAGRYDDGPDEAPWPDPDIVRDMVVQCHRSSCVPVAYCLDIGVLDSGETALVEANDAWALGFYSGTLSAADYLQMLCRRWQELFNASDPVKFSEATSQLSR